MLINAAIPYTLYSVPMSPLLHIQFHFYDRMLCDLPVVVCRCCVHTCDSQAGLARTQKNVMYAQERTELKEMWQKGVYRHKKRLTWITLCSSYTFLCLYSIQFCYKMLILRSAQIAYEMRQVNCKRKKTKEIILS